MTRWLVKLYRPFVLMKSSQAKKSKPSSWHLARTSYFLRIKYSSRGSEYRLTLPPRLFFLESCLCNAIFCASVAGFGLMPFVRK